MNVEKEESTFENENDKNIQKLKRQFTIQNESEKDNVNIYERRNIHK